MAHCMLYRFHYFSENGSVGGESVKVYEVCIPTVVKTLKSINHCHAILPICILRYICLCETYIRTVAQVHVRSLVEDGKTKV